MCRETKPTKHNSKIYGSFPQTFYLPNTKLHSILALANSLDHNNITVSYYGQVNPLPLK